MVEMALYCATRFFEGKKEDALLQNKKKETKTYVRTAAINNFFFNNNTYNDCNTEIYLNPWDVLNIFEEMK